MRVIELFAGVGSQTQALKNLGIKHEVIGISEIDKYAINSYEQLHGTVNNFGDISKIDILPTADLWTYSFPCQDISIAGKQSGFDKEGNTRSGLLWEVERLLKVSEKPKYLLMENVKNLVSKKFKPGFNKWCECLEEMGYKNYYHVLNAKDYGIPQNRERVFMISILGEHKPYIFPEKQELKTRLKDLLESEVEEKYYLSERILKGFIKTNLKNMGFKFNPVKVEEANIGHCITSGNNDRATDNFIIQVGNIKESTWKNPQVGRIYSVEGISPTLNICSGGGHEPKIIELGESKYQSSKVHDCNGIFSTLTAGTHGYSSGYIVQEATKKGYAEATEGDSLNLKYPGYKTRRGRVGKQISQTILTDGEIGVVDNCKIRKLTPKECWRLMGWKDEQFEKMQGISNTQLYKQAGNGIVVNVLEAILKNLFQEQKNKCENCEKYNNFICGKNGNYTLPTMEIMMNCNR